MAEKINAGRVSVGSSEVKNLLEDLVVDRNLV
jgi:hypothetical protein